MQASNNSLQVLSNCTICLERAGNAQINGCQHGFCLKCIRKWSNSKNTCPLCREPFLTIRHKNRVYRVKPTPQVAKQRVVRPRTPSLPREAAYLPLILNPIPLNLYYPSLYGNFYQSSYFYSPLVINFSANNAPYPSWPTS